MTMRRNGTREERLAAHIELLAAEKELTRRGDELALRRQELPWVKPNKEYAFARTASSTQTYSTYARGLDAPWGM